MSSYVQIALLLPSSRSGLATRSSEEWPIYGDESSNDKVAPSEASYRPRCKYCGGIMTVLATIQPAIEQGCELRTFECVCGHSVSVKVSIPNRNSESTGSERGKGSADGRPQSPEAILPRISEAAVKSATRRKAYSLRLWFTTMILPRPIRETNWTNISRFGKLDRTEGYSLTPYGIAT